jgi:hypothetical protein
VRRCHAPTVSASIPADNGVVAKHKFASNVVEKALEHSHPDDKRAIVEELIGVQPGGANKIAMLLRDPIANFPVQVGLSSGIHSAIAKSLIHADRSYVCGRTPASTSESSAPRFRASTEPPRSSTSSTPCCPVSATPPLASVSSRS